MCTVCCVQVVTILAGDVFVCSLTCCCPCVERWDVDVCKCSRFSSNGGPDWHLTANCRRLRCITEPDTHMGITRPHVRTYSCAQTPKISRGACLLLACLLAVALCAFRFGDTPADLVFSQRRTQQTENTKRIYFLQKKIALISFNFILSIYTHIRAQVCPS